MPNTCAIIEIAPEKVIKDESPRFYVNIFMRELVSVYRCAIWCLLLWNYYTVIFFYIGRTNSQNLTDSRLVLQLSLPNPFKPGVK